MNKLIISFKHAIKVLFYCLNNFGLLKGFSVFARMSLGLSDKIYLNGYKNPIYLRKDSSDGQVFYDIFLNKGSDISVNFTPKVILDIGANIGLFTLYMMKKFPSANYYCLEPDSDNFQVLEKNLGMFDNVKLHKCGIWNKDTFLKAYDKYDLGKWGVIVEETNEENGSIKGVSVDTLMKKESLQTVDILKVDIEATEKQLFKDNYSKWLKSVKVLVVEIHDGMEKGCGQTFFTAINNTFENYEYYVHGENTIIINNDL